MIREYEDLTPKEQDELSHAWMKIYEGLEVYERITGANSLDEIVYDEIWEQVLYQKGNENE